MKSTSVQDVFKKVHFSERKVIFREMASEKKQLLVKNEEDQVVYLGAFRIEGDEKLYCAAAPSSSLLTKDQEVTANFILNDENYFFRTQLTFENNIPVLNIAKDLFQLQRRANARLELPNDFMALANILEINGSPCFYIQNRIRDISAGGCKIFFPLLQPAIQVNDKLKITVHLSHRKPFQFLTEVRFAAVVTGGQIFGLQYLDRNNLIENRLLVLMMDLQRELYIKYGPVG